MLDIVVVGVVVVLHINLLFYHYHVPNKTKNH